MEWGSGAKDTVEEKKKRLLIYFRKKYFFNLYLNIKKKKIPIIPPALLCL